MIIDCHGHYTTAPRALEDYRKRQIEATGRDGDHDNDADRQPTMRSKKEKRDLALARAKEFGKKENEERLKRLNHEVPLPSRKAAPVATAATTPAKNRAAASAAARVISGPAALPKRSVAATARTYQHATPPPSGAAMGATSQVAILA